MTSAASTGDDTSLRISPATELLLVAGAELSSATIELQLVVFLEAAALRRRHLSKWCKVAVRLKLRCCASFMLGGEGDDNPREGRRSNRQQGTSSNLLWPHTTSSLLLLPRLAMTDDDGGDTPSSSCEE
jgi:hypothetical protein